MIRQETKALHITLEFIIWIRVEHHQITRKSMTYDKNRFTQNESHLGFNLLKILVISD